MKAPGTALVTGATGGIGRWIALGLAEAGHPVVLVGRNRERGEGVRSWIAAKVPSARTELVLLDLSSIAETRNLGRRIASEHGDLSLLVLNAGTFTARRQVTPEGHERVLATNHLSPFVLMRELEEVLRVNAPARIVTVGSNSSDRASIDPGNLELTRGWNMLRAYARSKLAVTMATFDAARRLQGTGVTANVVHPGAVATNLIRTPGIIGLSWRMLAPFFRSEEEGAVTPLHMALSPTLREATGLYLKDRRAVPPNPRALDPALVSRVCFETERLIGRS
ncbi:SDR family NAD(P)-dependent oxidoreductase [Aureimonas psammosilenae]|uniref:SDR family NAD(P)-dependent oxidoreductase n=1 Tax=Aureimonas psammosilenae TaxID=2495496 RepID=UPI0012606E11|nr:SDR family NAD(P)-dependent oxidoreductase [Aureimonas psammosilenae]